MGTSPKSTSRQWNPLMCSAAAFHAKTSAWPALVLAWWVPARASGRTMQQPFGLFDPDTCSWRTWQHSLFGGSEPFSGTWPRSGMMRSGMLYPRASLVPRISESGFSLWPTPTASDDTRARYSLESLRRQLRRNQSHGFQTGGSGGSFAARLADEFGCFLTPSLSRWTMGFPPDWCDSGGPNASRGYGNAVVPQVAELVGSWIVAHAAATTTYPLAA
jgi:hypothetical protein